LGFSLFGLTKYYVICSSPNLPTWHNRDRCSFLSWAQKSKLAEHFFSEE